MLEVVTRHLRTPRRAAMLRVQQSSLRRLSGDWMQTIMVDDAGVGVGASHLRLRSLEPQGSRVWVLDDDDTCIDDVTAHLNRAADMQIFRLRHVPLGAVLPRLFHARQLTCGDCGCAHVVLSRDLWMAARDGWTERYEGDFDFLARALSTAAIVTWTDIQIAEIPRISRGAG